MHSLKSYQPESRGFHPAVLLCLLLFLNACERPSAIAPQPGPPPVIQVTVSQPIVREVQEYDEFTGRLEAAESVEIRARVTGYLHEVTFTAGATVQKGDLLFVIDPRPYQAGVDKAKAALLDAEAKLQLAKAELARAQNLTDQGAMSRGEFDTRAAARTEAEAGVAGAKAALAAAQLDLDYTRITSPIKGRISRELVTTGNLVNANQTLLTTIVALDPLYAYIDPDERTILKYMQLSREGKRKTARESQVRVKVALANETDFPREGYIDFVENRMDATTGTLRARVVIPNADPLLTPGFFVRIRVPGSGNYQGTLVADHAIAMDQGRRYVMTVNSQNVLEQQPVVTGPLVDGLRVVREGIQPGQWIVVSGVQMLRPGMSVQPNRIPIPDPAAASSAAAK